MSPGDLRKNGWDREILRLALPALGALLAEPAYVLVDTAIVGHLGTPELGGLGVASTLSRLSVDLVVRTAALRASLVVATAVATRIGAVEVAAHQIVFEVWNALALALDAVAIAAQAMVGRLLGAGDADAARAATRRMLQWGAGAGTVFLVGVLLLRPALPGVFTDDRAVAGLAGFLLLHVALLQPVSGLVFTLDGILIGAGDLRFLAWAMAGAAVLFVPAALGVLALDLGIGWLWGAFALLQAARLAALGARWRGDRWLVLGVA